MKHRKKAVTIGQKQTQSILAIYPVIILSIFLYSCNGQYKKNSLNIKELESEQALIDTSKNKNQDAEQVYIDPLFYIDGQLCQHVRKIFQDKNGDIWFGTNIYDLMRYDGDTLQYFSEKEGVGGGRVTGIVEDQEGNVWFGMYGGMTKYNPSATLKTDSALFTNYPEKGGSLENEIWSVTIDSKGMFWIGTNEGVRQFDGKKFTPFPIPKAAVKDTTTIYADDRITSILEDRKGIMWFGTDGYGICKYDGKAFTHLTKAEGLPDNNISEMMQDREGNIWIGTMFGGMCKYDGKSFTNYTENGTISGVEVGGLFEDKKGNIWFAAENAGVYRYDGTSFTNFYKKDGLNTNGILSIFEDKEVRFWFGGWGGLFRFDGKLFSSVTKDGPWK